MISKALNTHIRHKAQSYKATAVALWDQLAAINQLPVLTPTPLYKEPLKDNKPMDETTKKVKRMAQRLNEVWSITKLPPENRNALSLLSYSQSLTRTNPLLQEETKKQEFTNVVRSEVARILGEDVAESVAKQLEHNHSISTAQHFTPLTSPNTLNATIQSGLGYFGNDHPGYANVIVFSCSNISFDNTYFPRGLLFHTNNETTLNLEQLVFFPRKARPFPLVFYPAYDKEAIEKMKLEVQTMFQSKKIDGLTKDKLITMLDEVYGNDWVLNSPTFTDQVTKTDFLLWKKIFEKSPVSVPNLVFISQEEIVLKLIEKYHLYSNTLIHQFLFTPEYMPIIEKYFDGIQGGFSLEKGTGSFMFWARPSGEKYRVQLFRKDNTLTTADGSYVLPLIPEAIQEAINKQELIPGTMLSMIVLSCYYGAILTGGLDQPRYLPQLQKAYAQVLTEMNQPEEAAKTSITPTTDNAITRPILAFIENHFGVIEPASGLDLCIYENNGWEQVYEAAKRVTIGDAITRLLPIMYKWYVPKDTWEEDLLGVAMQDIESTIPNEHKIPSWVKLG